MNKFFIIIKNLFYQLLRYYSVVLALWVWEESHCALLQGPRPHHTTNTKENYGTGELFYLPHYTKELFFSEITDVF